MSSRRERKSVSRPSSAMSDFGRRRPISHSPIFCSTPGLGEMELIPLSTDAHRNKGRLASRGLPGLRGQTPEDLAYLFLKVRKGEMPQNVIEGPPVDTYPKRRRPDSAQSWSAGEIPWRSEATRQRAHLSKKTLPEMMLNPKLISACDLKRSSRLALGRVRAYRGFDPSIARRRAKALRATATLTLNTMQHHELQRH